ncbi:hypothetical protein BKA59DRAFT_467825 [Fusarium tricinctum]|uniref:Uncharacterized protein n=1 Tax=Fusarium tricinctum TaxID=61284 RepID=A0A8K0WEI5_9HYPO|nr:hypothetical protein BKA59DRAFT_467825 [Fusarium tricinctum]
MIPRANNPCIKLNTNYKQGQGPACIRSASLIGDCFFFSIIVILAAKEISTWKSWKTCTICGVFLLLVIGMLLD